MPTSERSLLAPASSRRARPSLPPAPPAAPARFASLDGIRALAIATVFVNHSVTAGRFSPGVRALLVSPLLGLRGLGVTTFFVVSGFIITSTLLRELRRDGTIDVERFILRRSLRIFPAYFAFVAAVGLLTWGGLLPTNPRSFAYALTFSMNYAGQDAGWTLGHLWSMATQEQFYLLWPVMLLWAGRRNASRAAVATATLTPVVYLIYVSFWPAAFAARSSPFGFDTIVVGCLLALHREWLTRRPWFNEVVDSRIGIPLVFALGILGGEIGTRPGLLTHPLVPIAIALFVERCIRHPEGRLGRVLNSRPLVFVGTVSFSLYLWQQLFLRPETALPSPLDALAAVLVGLASYHAIERPAAALWPRIESWLAMRRIAEREPILSIAPALRGAGMPVSPPRAAAGGA